MFNGNSKESQQLTELDEVDLSRYIIFKLNEGLFGAKLLDVREVVEMPTIKPIPNTKKDFVGICNLRGQIIGVIDLKQKFGLQRSESDRPVLLVFESESGAIAAVIDQIAKVTTIEEKDIERGVELSATVILEKYIFGIAKSGDSLITLLDLKSLLTTDEVAELNISKASTKAA